MRGLILIFALLLSPVMAQSPLADLQVDRAAALKAGEHYLHYIKAPPEWQARSHAVKNWNVGIPNIEQKIKLATGRNVDLHTLPDLTPAQGATPVPGEPDGDARLSYRIFYHHLHDGVLPKIDAAIADLTR